MTNIDMAEYIEYLRELFDSRMAPFIQAQKELDAVVPPGEVQVFWNPGAAAYLFTRAAVVRSRYRRGCPHFWTSGAILGFSNLGPDAPCIDGWFLRRVFFLHGIDLTPESPYPLAHTNHRFCDGVRISSVRPGEWGVQL